MRINPSGCVLVAATAINLVAFQNCSPVSFAVDDKLSAMKTDIFDDGTKEGSPSDDGPSRRPPSDEDSKRRQPPGTTPGTTPGNTPGQSLPPTPTAGGSTTTPPALDLPVTRQCSDKKSKNFGTNVMSSATLRVDILTPGGTVVCTTSNTATILANLKLQKISFTNCPLTDGNYDVKVTAGNGENLVVDDGSFSVVGGVIEDAELEVLMDSNPNRDDNDSTIPVYKGAVCDELASPLFIDLRRDSNDLDVLSSPANGVLFDILGANNNPAYTKSKISWFEKGKFGLLALPDSQGSVRNIDQLFGDNTKGPDGKFADNGFLALAKFDKNRDGRIDSKDPIYSQLRLWLDKDRDARSKPEELVSLSSLGIVAIDLAYDPNFSERDKYGNEIKYKSAVELVDGKFRSIFDIWFKLH